MNLSNSISESSETEMDVHTYSELIGKTALIDLSHYVRNDNAVRLLAKVEFLNPGFSIKDRIIRHIVDKAEKRGALKPGMTIVAASSGNTGASTAMVAAMKNYSAIIYTSPKCSKEKMDSIRAYGAELRVSKPGVDDESPESYMSLANTLCKENPDQYFDIDQYENLINADAYYKSLGPEIWEQTLGKVTHFVAAGSTGGTISGTGRYLKMRNKNIKIILGDPVGSIFTNYFRTNKVGLPKKFLVEGVGKGSIPGVIDFNLIDDVINVTDSDAFSMCYSLARRDGILAGGSSGLNTYCAIQVANQLPEDGVVVTVLPDTGIKYLSKIYQREWLEENNVAIRDIN